MKDNMRDFLTIMVTPIIVIVLVIVVIIVLVTCVLLNIEFELIHELTPGWSAMCGTNMKYYAYLRSGCCALAKLENMTFDTTIKMMAWLWDEPEENLLKDLLQ